MDSKQLTLAQMLYDSFLDATELSDALNRERQKSERKEYVGRKLDAVARFASDAFISLTGKTPNEVKSITELSTVNPAKWTESVNPW